MMGNRFTGIQSLIDLGETICCVYFLGNYDETKAIQYMKWVGFNVSYMYRSEKIILFYQEERFVPRIENDVDYFFHRLPIDLIWDGMPSGAENDYKYRNISDGVICISFTPINKDADSEYGSGKAKKE